MSRYFSNKYESLTPYTPGEQPQDMQYIKLNTNESPFPPSLRAQELAANAANSLQLYSDPECRELVNIASSVFGVNTDEIIFTNGSDEVLNFAFMAFCDDEHPAVFPNVTYGFYKVFAELNGIPYSEIPLKSDFTVNVGDYLNVNKTVFIANPNAPTGIALETAKIEEIIKSNPDNIVVIDEAYVDFGGQSVIPLIRKYDNLLVVGTFSKSRSLAGGRLGFGIANSALIRDLNTIKYSTNPYNINRMTAAAGIGALQDSKYFADNCNEIIRVRKWTECELKKLGFTFTDSKTNFIFARHENADGKQLYLKLKEKGVLIRHFDTELLGQYNRITVGSEEQMKIFIEKVKQCLEEL
ncbi:MAG: histidinol-phosphate transaminase [Acutalibacteraceae bacterium]|nr:histidinol-phosphate transaminase [Acutalibacteraceae bacterium]